MEEKPLDPQQGLDFMMDDNTSIAVATTVYIVKAGKVLLMKQTKPNSVVGKYYVGIGGKTPIETYLGNDKEKVRHDVVVSSMLSGDFNIEEPIEDLAVREVKEEVRLSLDKGKLQDIGMTEVRLLNPKSNELWYIKNYLYYADGTEGELTESNEGTLEFVPVEDIKTKPMLPHDRIIFGEKNPNIHIQSMNDDIHGKKQLRIRLQKQNQIIYLLLPDLQTKPIDVRGVIAKRIDEIPEPYKYLTKNLSEDKIKEYLETLGISEERVGTINTDNSPIDIGKYIE